MDSAEYELYIMRHGIAEDRGKGVDDARRALTHEGKAKVHKAAEGLNRLGIRFDWVVSSPLIRAAETAAIVAEEMDSKPPRDFCDALKPGGSAEDLIAFLAKHPSRRHVLVVGHEPDLGELTARLIGAGRNASLPFKKGGCCMITFGVFPPKSPGHLTWWLTPGIMRKLR